MIWRRNRSEPMLGVPCLGFVLIIYLFIYFIFGCFGSSLDPGLTQTVLRELTQTRLLSISEGHPLHFPRDEGMRAPLPQQAVAAPLHIPPPSGGLSQHTRVSPLKQTAFGLPVPLSAKLAKCLYT